MKFFNIKIAKAGDEAVDYPDQSSYRHWVGKNFLNAPAWFDSVEKYLMRTLLVQWWLKLEGNGSACAKYNEMLASTAIY